ncbi:MAG: GNAT family N-acetyltransferase, partial [Brevundimonas sp.]
MTSFADPAVPASKTWRIVDAPSPVGLDIDDAAAVWAYAGLSDVQQQDELATWGWDDRWAPLFVWLPMLQDDTYVANSLSVAVRDVAAPTSADVLGAVLVTMPREGSTDLAHGYVVVRPDERGAGIGTALLAHGEQVAAAAGRTRFVVRSAEAPEPPAGPETLTAPTGAGRVRADAPSSRFALRHGFALEQVERYSVLQVS